MGTCFSRENENSVQQGSCINKGKSNAGAGKEFEATEKSTNTAPSVEYEKEKKEDVSDCKWDDEAVSLNSENIHLSIVNNDLIDSFSNEIAKKIITEAELDSALQRSQRKES